MKRSSLFISDPDLVYVFAIENCICSEVQSSRSSQHETSEGQICRGHNTHDDEVYCEVDWPHPKRKTAKNTRGIHLKAHAPTPKPLNSPLRLPPDRCDESTNTNTPLPNTPRHIPPLLLPRLQRPQQLSHLIPPSLPHIIDTDTSHPHVVV